MRIRGIFLCTAIIIVTILLCGCSSQQSIDALLSDSSTELQGTGAESGNFIDGIFGTAFNITLPRAWYFLSFASKHWAPAVIVGSIMFGNLLLEIFKINKEIHKFVWLTLFLRIPIISFVFVYVFALLYGVCGYGDEGVWDGFIHLFTNDFPVLWYVFCEKYTVEAVVVMLGSFLLGIILFEIFKTNTDMRKFAKTVLLRKIPFWVFMIVFCYSSLYEVLHF